MKISLTSGMIINALRIIADRAHGRVVEYSVFRFTENPVEIGAKAVGIR